jgi:hypothetical protein
LRAQQGEFLNDQDCADGGLSKREGRCDHGVLRGREELQPL